MPKSGFTLIELLVVIAIMAIVGVFTLANYKSFGEDQNLKNAVLDIQSQLRTAQTNATTNVKCNTLFGATWQVKFTDTKTTNLNCQEPQPPLLVPKKTLTLGTNIAIQSVSGTGSSCPSALSFTINFAPVSGKISIKDNTRDYPNCTLLTITLKNTKTNSTKALVIEKGGRIYAQ